MPTKSRQSRGVIPVTRSKEGLDQQPSAGHEDEPFNSVNTDLIPVDFPVAHIVDKFDNRVGFNKLAFK